jgi:hypothetical protein
VAAVPTPKPLPARDRRFYLAMALAVGMTTFVGFGPTFYLGPIYDARPLPPLIVLHGVVFTAWIVLLLVQSSLVTLGRLHWHRRLGVAGAALASLMLVVGALAAIASARRGFAPNGLDPLTFMAVPFGSLALFAGFFGAAVAWRRRPELHKRLVLLATIAILTPAIARFGFVHQRPVIALALTNLFVLVAIAYDWRSRGRVAPAYLWGGLAIALSGPLRILIGRSGAWHAFGAYLIS